MLVYCSIIRCALYASNKAILKRGWLSSSPWVCHISQASPVEQNWWKRIIRLPYTIRGWNPPRWPPMEGKPGRQGVSQFRKPEAWNQRTHDQPLGQDQGSCYTGQHPRLKKSGSWMWGTAGGASPAKEGTSEAGVDFLSSVSLCCWGPKCLEVPPAWRARLHTRPTHSQSGFSGNTSWTLEGLMDPPSSQLDKQN